MTDSISILIKHYFLWKCLYQKWKAKILLKAQIIPCPFLWMRNNSDRRHVCFLFLLLQILPFPLNIRYGRVRTLFCVTLATKQLKKKNFFKNNYKLSRCDQWRWNDLTFDFRQRNISGNGVESKKNIWMNDYSPSGSLILGISSLSFI